MANFFAELKRHHIYRVAAAYAVAAFACSAQAVAAERNNQVYQRAEQYKDQALQLLGRMVNIDSGTGDVSGVGGVAALATAELKALGARVETVPNVAGGGDNTVASFSGTGKGKLLLIAHMDTVFATGAKTRPFRVADGRAYGPGVADDKGGVIAALYALKIMRDLKFTDFAQITLLLNSNEETGSLGSRPLIEKLSKEHGMVLNFEAGRPGDGLVIWRKGSGDITVQVKGRNAHAGIEPEKGRNAAMELVHQMSQLTALDKPELGTAIIMTVLKAGERTNVIPDSAEGIADIRTLSAKEFDRVEKELAVLSKKNVIPDTEVTLTLHRGFPPMQQNPTTDALAARAQAIYTELGKLLNLEGTGAAADSSLAAGIGVPVLDGFGIVGGGAHSPDEYIEIDSIVPRLYLAARMVMELAPGK